MDFLFTFVNLKIEDDQWCNGSTTDFGSVSLGSNPGWSTKFTIFCFLVNLF